jgi:hypothetical protein
MITYILNLVILGIIFSTLLKGAKGKPLEQHLIPGLTFKIACGIAMGFLYRHYYTPDGDTYFLFNQASFLADIFRDNPLTYFKLVFLNEFSEISKQFFQNWNQPRAFFFIKIISVVNILTANNYWISSVYFSIFSFSGAFWLANLISEKFRISKIGPAIAFLYFPSYVFWTSGIIKESVAAGCICFTIFLALRCFDYKRWIPLLAPLAFCIFTILYLKYYYAAVLLPFLAIYCLYEIMKGKTGKLVIAGTAVACLILFITALSVFHLNLTLSYFPTALFDNYLATIRLTEKPDLIFSRFTPSWAGIIRSLPEGIVTGLLRPFIWESEQNIQLLAGLENFLTLCLSVSSLIYVFWVRKIKGNSVAWITLTYVVVLSGLIALASPNFGSLLRYRVGYYPFFIILITCQNPAFDFFFSSFKITRKRPDVMPQP